jgi:hypothetical protein
MEELHLIIIWSEALNKKEDILKDLESKFEIINIYNVTWSDKNFSNNLSRFYGENLPKNSHKEAHCGKDTFCCIVVKDANPNYGARNTSKGSRVVNINLFDIKHIYRSWTGGGHKIHATDNIQEAEVQLALLFGLSYDKLIMNNNNSTDELSFSNDLVGANGWKSFDELFKILNLTVNYVVLRNFDNLEEQLTSKHSDVDMLVEDRDLVIDMLNAKETTKIPYRAQYNVIIDNKKINFDIRYIGDDYYDKFWEMDILETKVINKKGFYIPNDNHHFYSLIYHALIHKKCVSEDYIEKFIEISKRINYELLSSRLVDYELLNILFKFMRSNRYDFVEPYDLTVFYNQKLIKNKILTLISEARFKKYYKPTLIKQLKKAIKKVILTLISEDRFNKYYRLALIKQLKKK